MRKRKRKAAPTVDAAPPSARPEPLLLRVEAPEPVVLRTWTQADAPALLCAWRDPQVSAWNQVPPEPTLEAAERWIGGVAARFERRVSVDLVIDSAAHGGVVGEVGLSGFGRSSRSGVGHAMVGYWLLPAARGFGLATAAVETFTSWAHNALTLDMIIARCHEANTRSQAVAARAGFSKQQRVDGYDLWVSRRPSNPTPYHGGPASSH